MSINNGILARPLGFPYGLSLTHPSVGFLPFTKRATPSASEDVPGGKLWYLDGLNNPGFSGGPVVFARIGAFLLFPFAAMTVIWLGLALLYAAASIWDFAISTLADLLWRWRTRGVLGRRDLIQPEFHRLRLTLWLENLR